MVTLRPDQSELIDRVQAAMRRHPHVCLQAGCGYGKTTVFSEVVRRAVSRGTRTLVLAHRRRLIDQISDRLAQFGVPHRLLMADLSEKLRDRSDPGALVTVASKDTLISRAVRNEWSGLPDARLVIPDEAHTVLGSGYADLIRRYDAAYRLGPTATPVAGDGRGLGGFFGEMVQALPVSACIARGLSVPVRVYAALEVADARKAGGTVKPAGDPVVQWLRHAEGRPTVLFAPRITDSRAVVEAFVRAGVPAVHIDAHTPEAERDAAADGLEAGTIKVVSQVGLWTEGVDVPCLAVCQLLAKCGSLVKYVQAIGRIMRAFPGKRYATVIDHTGAVFEHGFPDEDIEWALSDGEPRKATGANDNAEEGGGKEPFVCSKCGLCYSGAIKCPGCGSELAINRKMYQPDLFAHLVEVDRDYKEAARDESAQRVWTSLLFQFARSGKTVKAASAAFHGRTGEWPDRAGVFPVPTRADAGERVVDVFPEFGAKTKRGAVGPALFAGGE